MKKIIILVTLAATAMLLGACFKDLDRLPRNESDFTADKAYDNTAESYAKGLAKIYGGFALVGNNGPGESDISVSDAGASEFIRAWWCMQELTTDAAKVAWPNDKWGREINTNTWSSVPNEVPVAVYERCILVASYVNEFLRQTTDNLLDNRGASAEVKGTVARYRAEARFVRAYVYWMLMDAYGNPPFFTENDPVGDFFPPQIQRADLFKWIEGELVDLTKSASLPAVGASRHTAQVDKGAAWALLARIYLNAKVYSGTDRLADAASAAAEVIKGSYTLADQYAELFMADNSENPAARKELIWVVAYDGLSSQSWGGTTFLVNGSLADSDEGKHLNGSKGWAGQRTTLDYARKFGVTEYNYNNGSYKCDDKRGMFYIKGRQEEIDDMTQFNQGWDVVKYSRYPSGTDLANPVVPAGDHSSGDFPMIRLGEMYLIYAEAKLVGTTTGTDATALGYLNALRVRAGLVGDLNAYDIAYIRDERARELVWEAHRRTDLVRWGLYTGGDYVWPWKGGVKEGRSIDGHYNLFPILRDDINKNSNLKQNPGYAG